MSIEESLIKEYIKLKHNLAINTERLKRCPNGVMRKRQLQFYTKRQKRDIRMITRALGLFKVCQLNKQIKSAADFEKLKNKE